MAREFNKSMYDIGQNIRQARMDRGMSQTELALAMDTNKNAVSRWESGDRILKLDSLLRLADVLDVPASGLLDTKGEGGDEWEAMGSDFRRLSGDDQRFLLKTVRTLLHGLRP